MPNYSAAQLRDNWEKHGERRSVLDFIPSTLHSAIRERTSVVDMTTYLQDALNEMLSVKAGRLYFTAGRFPIEGGLSMGDHGLTSESTGQVIYADPGSELWLADGSGDVSLLHCGIPIDPAGATGSDGAMTSGSATLTSASAAFTSELIGKSIRVRAAGAAGADLISTVSSVTDGTHIVLSHSASSTVSASVYVIGTAESLVSSTYNAIYGLTLNGNKAGNPGLTSPVLRLHNCAFSDFQVVVADGPADNIEIGGSSVTQSYFSSRQNRLAFVRTTGAGGSGLRWHNDYGTTISAIHALDNESHGIHLAPNSGTLQEFMVLDNTIGEINLFRNGGDGIRIEPGVVRLSVSAGSIRKNSGYGVNVVGVSFAQEYGSGPAASEEIGFGVINVEDNASGGYYFGPNTNHITVAAGGDHQPRNGTYAFWLDAPNGITIANQVVQNFGSAYKITSTADTQPYAIQIYGGTVDTVANFLTIDSSAGGQAYQIQVRGVRAGNCSGTPVVLVGELGDVDIEGAFSDADPLDYSALTYGGNRLRFHNTHGPGYQLLPMDNTTPSLFGSDVWVTQAGGTCSTSGTSVTRLGGQSFTGMTGTIKITNVAYQIASVSDSDHLTLTTSAGTQASTYYSFVPTGIQYDSFGGGFMGSTVTIVNPYYEGVTIKNSGSIVLRDSADFVMQPGESITLVAGAGGVTNVWNEVSRNQGLTNAGAVRTTTDQTVGGQKTFSSNVRGSDGFTTNDTFNANAYYGGSPAGWRYLANGRAYRLTMSVSNGLALEVAVSGSAGDEIEWVNVANLLDDGTVVLGAYAPVSDEAFRVAGKTLFGSAVVISGNLSVSGSVELPSLTASRVALINSSKQITAGKVDLNSASYVDVAALTDGKLVVVGTGRLISLATTGDGFLKLVSGVPQTAGTKVDVASGSDVSATGFSSGDFPRWAGGGFGPYTMTDFITYIDTYGTLATFGQVSGLDDKITEIESRLGALETSMDSAETDLASLASHTHTYTRPVSGDTTTASTSGPE